ncbi:Major facilitator superfamily [Pseudomonas coronafaciens pv. zizaniae]|nr:Major facilitator superfamily [Pseudomonas coronafaciens pv. zizaniae]
MVNIMIKDFLALNRSLQGRLIANFFRRASTDSLVPFMTIYLVDKLGSFLAGIIIVMILSIGMMANTLGGVATTRYSNRKLLVKGEALHTIVIMGMVLAVSISTTLLVVLYLLKSIIFSYLTPAGEKVILDNTSKENRKFAFQLNMWISGAAIPIGLGIGAVLYGINIEYLLVFTAMASLASAVLHFFCVTSSSNHFPQGMPEKKISFSSYKLVFQNKPACLIVVSAALLFTIEFSFAQYFPVYLNSKSNLALAGKSITGADLFAIIKSASSITALFFSFFFISLIKKINDRKTLMLAVVSFLVCFLAVFVLADNPLIIIFLVCFSSIFSTVYHPLRQVEFTKHIESNMSGLYLSIYSLTARAGNIMAGFILMMADYFSHMAVIATLAVFGALSIIMLAFVPVVEDGKEKTGEIREL